MSSEIEKKQLKALIRRLLLEKISQDKNMMRDIFGTGKCLKVGEHLLSLKKD